jgi:hypothetical protein
VTITLIARALDPCLVDDPATLSTDIEVRLATMLAGDDMLQMERLERR